VREDDGASIAQAKCGKCFPALMAVTTYVRIVPSGREDVDLDQRRMEDGGRTRERLRKRPIVAVQLRPRLSVTRKMGEKSARRTTGRKGKVNVARVGNASCAKYAWIKAFNVHI